MTQINRGVVLTSSGEGLLDDLAFAAELGAQHVRLDVSWSAAQPKAGRFAVDVFERAHADAAAARALGMEPWFRLLQPALPHWFEDEGGFGDERTAGLWWPRWVEAAADQLGSVAAGWVPFEAPVAMCRRLQPADPRKFGELMYRLIVAWRDSWRILRGGPPVATSLDMPDHVSNGWLDALADGVVRIPGWADRELADLESACDVVGLALRRDVENALYRSAERGPERPLAIVFRPEGDNDNECARSVATMWRAVDNARDELDLLSVSATPFLDSPGQLGLATAARRLKDAGEAFFQPRPR